ncbi:hypothetical protein Phi39:1_gp27 [Cellulophaga phage phi39:1]|uniref:hypothetical protein n=1 Tax=Cellulophaga phage phi39:1 TaxID=1327993 RepID=UPI000351E618|nr:hypothetical protein Phi39:1_gp27 [Cellulophaga phage phi39:1]AGO49142.1 hypothetical protein Phi39:1_gp27 [Cellulophaga phage phi39:1]
MIHFFGEIGFMEYLAFIFFTLLGMAFVKIVKYNIKKKAALRAAVPYRIMFNYKIWLDDNLLDFICAFIASFTFYRFFPDAMNYILKFMPGGAVGAFQEKMFYGLILGLFFQYLLHKLMNNVTVEKTINKI